MRSKIVRFGSFNPANHPKNIKFNIRWVAIEASTEKL